MCSASSSAVGLLTEDTVEDMFIWQASGGFSLDASVRIHGSDSAGRERLLRYCARPPFALERLRIERRGEGAEERTATATYGDAGVRQVLYLPARPTRDGRTVLALSPLESLAALARLIPPPRVHRHRYHGVLAPNARLREPVIQLGRDDAAATGGTDSLSDGEPRDTATAADTDAADLPDSPRRAAARSRWARLLARIYEVFPLAFARTAGEFRIEASHAGHAGYAGYAAVEPIELRLEREETLVVQIALTRDVVAIEPLTVTARRRDARHDLSFEGARTRHALYPSLGPRRVIMRSDWEFASAMKVQDVLGDLRPTGCVVMYHNGNRVRPENQAAWIEESASFMEAVEYYREGLDAPLGLRAGAGQCAVIALWPRLDAPRGGRPWLRAGIAAAVLGLLLLLGT